MVKRSSAGFTLIELLVIISIIAILAAIILPVFLNMRKTTRFTTCAQNLKEIGTALAMYRAEFGCYPSPPEPNYMQYMNPESLPYSSEREWDIVDQQPAINWQWNIVSKSSDYSVTLDSIAGLSTDMPITMLDTKTGKTESSKITDISGMVVTVDNALKNTYAIGGKIREATITVKLTEVGGLSSGMLVNLQPTSSWDISSMPSTISVTLNSVANLTTGMPVKLQDKASGNTESVSITGIDYVNLLVTVDPALQETYLQGGSLKSAIPISRELHEIDNIDVVNKTVTFKESLLNDYSPGGGTMVMEPIRVQAQTVDPAHKNQLLLERINGLQEGMRVTIYSYKPDGITQPSIIDQPYITSSNVNPVIFNSDLRQLSFTGKEYVTWSVGNYGLATLYQLYLSDKKNYLRSFQLFHCPSISNTEKVDRGSILAQSDNPAFHSFDPLFAGYNSYDANYNYDQFEGTIDPGEVYSIKGFDQEMGLASDVVYRELKNPNCPADTVVSWCSGHLSAGETGAKSGLAADTDEARKVAEREVSSLKNLILFIDGSVSPISPYALQGSDGRYYWVPPFLYSRGVVK